MTIIIVLACVINVNICALEKKQKSHLKIEATSDISQSVPEPEEEVNVATKSYSGQIPPSLANFFFFFNLRVPEADSFQKKNNFFSFVFIYLLIFS